MKKYIFTFLLAFAALFAKAQSDPAPSSPQSSSLLGFRQIVGIDTQHYAFQTDGWILFAGRNWVNKYFLRRADSINYVTQHRLDSVVAASISTITPYTAGYGLNLTGKSFSVDTNKMTTLYNLNHTFLNSDPTFNGLNVTGIINANNINADNINAAGLISVNYGGNTVLSGAALYTPIGDIFFNGSGTFGISSDIELINNPQVVSDLSKSQVLVRDTSAASGSGTNFGRVKVINASYFAYTAGYGLKLTGKSFSIDTTIVPTPSQVFNGNNTYNGSNYFTNQTLFTSGSNHTYITGGQVSLINGTTGNSIAFAISSNPYLAFNIGSIAGRLHADNITATRDWELPDESTTLAGRSDNISEFTNDAGYVTGSSIINYTASSGIIKTGNNFTLDTAYAHSVVQPQINTLGSRTVSNAAAISSETSRATTAEGLLASTNNPTLTGYLTNNFTPGTNADSIGHGTKMGATFLSQNSFSGSGTQIINTGGSMYIINTNNDINAGSWNNLNENNVLTIWRHSTQSGQPSAINFLDSAGYETMAMGNSNIYTKGFGSGYLRAYGGGAGYGQNTTSTAFITGEKPYKAGGYSGVYPYPTRLTLVQEGVNTAGVNSTEPRISFENDWRTIFWSDHGDSTMVISARAAGTGITAYYPFVFNSTATFNQPVSNMSLTGVTTFFDNQSAYNTTSTSPLIYGSNGSYSTGAGALILQSRAAGSTRSIDFVVGNGTPFMAMSITGAGLVNLPLLSASGLIGTDGSKNLSIITALPNATTATTQTTGDATTKVATDAFVSTALTNSAILNSTSLQTANFNINGTAGIGGVATFSSYQSILNSQTALLTTLSNPSIYGVATGSIGAGDAGNLLIASRGTAARDIYFATNNLIAATIDRNQHLGIGTYTPTAFLQIAASTTGYASLRLTSGVAPTAPNSGDFWNLSGTMQYYDGTATRSIANLAGTQTFTNKTIGDKLRITTAANGGAGTATLASGTVTVANTSVTSNSIIILSRGTAGGTVGTLSYSLSAGTSFTIASSSSADTSTISYLIIN